MAIQSSLRARHKPDYILSLVVIILAGIGMVMLYSTGSVISYNLTGGVSDKNHFFQSQLTILVIGLIGWYIVSKIDYRKWRKWAPYIFYVAVGLMLLVMLPLFALKVNGATRWLRLGLFSFQPVEFFKLALILYLASWFEKNRGRLSEVTHGLLPFLFILGLISGLVVFLQKDLGSALIVVGIATAMYFASGAPLLFFGISLAGLGTGLAAAIMFFPYRLARLTTFLSHREDTASSSYHINQALIALGSGGVTGRGLGNSYQVYGYLPEATNDSIFAVIGEQFGFIGTFIITLLFSIVIYRGYVISRRSNDSYAKSVALGITVWIGLQAIINIAAMLNLLPLTGVPLPFISYGGTSLLFTLIAMGILQNISRYSSTEVHNETRSSGRRNRRTYRADIGGARKVRGV